MTMACSDNKEAQAPGAIREALDAATGQFIWEHKRTMPDIELPGSPGFRSWQRNFDCDQSPLFRSGLNRKGPI
jgi:hypothetical protein